MLNKQNIYLTYFNFLHCEFQLSMSIHSKWPFFEGDTFDVGPQKKTMCKQTPYRFPFSSTLIFLH